MFGISISGGVDVDKNRYPGIIYISTIFFSSFWIALFSYNLRQLFEILYELLSPFRSSYSQWSLFISLLAKLSPL